MDDRSTPAPAHPLRRRLLLGGVGAAAAAIALPRSVRAQARKPLKVSVGRIPWAAGNSPMTQYMINNKLLEKRAAELGYELTVDWREYPTALPMVEAMVGNNLDMGMWGNTPIIRGLTSGLPISLTKPLGVGVLNNRHKSTGEVSQEAIASMVTLNLDAARAALAPLTDARLGAAPHSLRAVAPADLAAVAAMTDGPLHMHLAEQPAEAVRLGVLRDRVIEAVAGDLVAKFTVFTYPG